MEIEILGRHIYIRREIMITAAVLIILILGSIGYVIKAKGGEVIVNKETMADEYTKQEEKEVADIKVSEEATAEAIKDIEQIKVYVVGCINKPGVVTLEKGQIIDDAIKAAGGATEEADLENINLAYELNENVMLKIFSKKETQIIKQITQNQYQNQERKDSAKAMTGVKIAKDSGGAIVSDNTAESKNAEKKGKININTATTSELDTLPGVGEKTAADIIAYREKNGNFKKIEDIMNVPRIGEGRFAQMKELITVQ